MMHKLRYQIPARLRKVASFGSCQADVKLAVTFGDFFHGPPE